MTASSGKTLVVIPCYNEAARLDRAACLAALARQPSLELVFVDDGSRDGTAAMLGELRDARPDHVHVLGLPSNQGKAEAVRRGVLEAFGRDAALVGYWDADLATPLDAIPAFVSVLGDPRIQMVMGSRVKLLGRHIERDLARHYLGRGFATVVASALGLAVYDTQCGAKLFRAGPLFARVFSQPFRSRWTFDVEILVRLLREEKDSGAIRVSEQCVELPLDEWRDQPGSKLRFRHIPRILVELAGLLREAPRRGSRPLG